MRSRVLLIAAACFGAMGAWSACSGGGTPPAATCSTSNCNGCCNVEGECVAGDTPQACGAGGESCQSCGPGLTCAANACTGSMTSDAGNTGGDAGTSGTDAGSTGGDAGSTGTDAGTTGRDAGLGNPGVTSDGGLTTDAGTGGDGGLAGADAGSGQNATCDAVNFDAATPLGGSWTASTSDGGVAVSSGFIGRQSLSNGRMDFIGVRLRYTGESVNPTFPLVRELEPTTFRDCDVCVLYQEACDVLGGNCARTYLGQGGAAAILSATRDPVNGVFRAAGDDVLFRQWDVLNDVAAPDAGCVTMDFTMNVTWGDAGISEPSDAGTGGGTGGLDGGTSTGADGGHGTPADAGMGTLDAGTSTDGGATDGGDPGGRLPGQP